MTYDIIIQWIKDHILQIIVFFILAFSVNIYSKFIDLSKHIPKFLINIAKVKSIVFLRKFFIYCLPILVMLAFIWTYRNSLVTFGIVGLFVIFCVEYSMLVILLLLHKILKTLSVQADYEEDKQGFIIKNFDILHKTVKILMTHTGLDKNI